MNNIANTFEELEGASQREGKSMAMPSLILLQEENLKLKKELAIL